MSLFYIFYQEGIFLGEKLILDGKKVSNHVRESLKPRIAALKEKGIQPCLATILLE